MPVPCCLECVRPLPDASPCGVCGKAPEALEAAADAERTGLPLYHALRDWTRRQARVQGGEPYMVLPKAAAARVALVQPTTREALRRVKGVGPVKDKDYGALLVQWLRAAAGAEAPPPVPLARAPMPEGLSEAEEAAVLALREAARPLPEILPGDPWEGVAALVAKGATDLVRLVVSPFDVALVLRWCEAHPGRTPGAADLPGVSDAALRLAPLLLAETEDTESREHP